MNSLEMPEYLTIRKCHPGEICEFLVVAIPITGLTQTGYTTKPSKVIAMRSEGYYWFREPLQEQNHLLRVFKKDANGRQEVHDLSGHMPTIRGFRYADELKGVWWKIEEPGGATCVSET